jgi:3-hydroxymyristoyl/3-hydroxydecanoyl-(acyl carrier protein) dehydratase
MVLVSPVSQQKRTFARPLDAVDSYTVRRTEAGLLVEAAKTVRATDPYLAGHFPGRTLYPAIFLLEGVRQAVGAARAESGDDDDWLELHSLGSVRILKPMLAGDELRLRIEVTPAAEPGVLHTSVTCRRADGLQVATMTVELVPGGDA